MVALGVVLVLLADLLYDPLRIVGILVSLAAAVLGIVAGYGPAGGATVHATSRARGQP